VLALMGDGLSNADIAERLSISEKTVRNHASNIFDKLGVWSRAQAIVFARDRGFRGVQQ
jgi:DNA-binding NarL/FixJ family response regulator